MDNEWILSFDGGGCRFVLEMVFLHRILQKFPELEKRIKVVAGTSAGSLIASSIATKGFSEAYKLLMTPELMKKVFSITYTHSVTSLKGWNAAAFTHDGLLNIIKSQFSETDTLNQVPKMSNGMHLLIPAFCVSRKPYPVSIIQKEPSSLLTLTHLDEDIDEKYSQTPHLSWCPRIYHTMDPVDGHGHVPIVDILMQSTSAPTYFPSWKGCVDGGVVANNPSMLAYSSAIKTKTIVDPSKIRLLSFGSGICPSNMDAFGDNANIGIRQWIPYLSTMFVEANTEITVVECMNLLGPDQFHRIQPVLNRIVLLEECTAFDELKAFAESYDLAKTFEWIQTNL